MIDTASLHRKEFEIDDGSERIVIAESPGRLHFLGDHGQPDNGIFLTSGVDRVVRVAVSLRKDSSLRFFTAEIGERKRSSLANLRYKREDRWANYCKAALNVFANLGCELKGVNFTISGDIPQHISLSSSSAIEVASALALRRLLLPSLSDKDLICKLAASHAEFYNGKNRIVDYLTMVCAKKDHFLIIDEATLDVKRIKNPFTKYKILLLDSRVPLIDAESELKLRRKEIEKGFELLNAKNKAKSFKEFNKDDLDELMGSLNEEVRRRSLFVIQENERVLESEKWLIDADKDVFSRDIFHSHEGLRDLFEVSCPEIDWLVKRAQEIPGVIGARMTGKGFGGCVYVIIASTAVEEYESKMDDYERIFGFRPVIYEIHLSGAAKLLVK
ncbi:MAG: galactokinase [Spirochaetaceae bacterium]|jgi:galactokinase|nr:galactokinase [Spirochaetaceae bacterium]